MRILLFVCTFSLRHNKALYLKLLLLIWYNNNEYKTKLLFYTASDYMDYNLEITASDYMDYNEYKTKKEKKIELFAAVFAHDRSK